MSLSHKAVRRVNICEASREQKPWSPYLQDVQKHETPKNNCLPTNKNLKYAWKKIASILIVSKRKLRPRCLTWWVIPTLSDFTPTREKWKRGIFHSLFWDQHIFDTILIWALKKRITEWCFIINRDEIILCKILANV